MDEREVDVVHAKCRLAVYQACVLSYLCDIYNKHVASKEIKPSLTNQLAWRVNMWPSYWLVDCYENISREK